MVKHPEPTNLTDAAIINPSDAPIVNPTDAPMTNPTEPPPERVTLTEPHPVQAAKAKDADRVREEKQAKREGRKGQEWRKPHA